MFVQESWITASKPLRAHGSFLFTSLESFSIVIESDTGQPVFFCFSAVYFLYASTLFFSEWWVTTRPLLEKQEAFYEGKRLENGPRGV